MTTRSLRPLRPRVTAWIAATVLLVASLGIAYDRGALHPASTATREHVPAAQRGARPAIRATIEREVDPLQSPADLAPYLAKLEERAARNGAVTALEVEPGLVASRKLGDPEAGRAFAERMASLSARLSHRQ